MAALEVEGVLASASCALKALGINLPRKVSSGRVALKLWKIKRMLRRKTDRDILSLSAIQSMAAAARLLVHVCSYCLVNNAENQAVYAALSATELTLRFGLSPYSANSLAIYGVAEVTLGNYDEAYRFGRLALTLLQRVKCRDAECATVGVTLSLLSHWKEPLQEVTEQLFRAAKLGFGIGDITYVSFLYPRSVNLSLFSHPIMFNSHFQGYVLSICIQPDRAHSRQEPPASGKVSPSRLRSTFRSRTSRRAFVVKAHIPVCS